MVGILCASSDSPVTEFTGQHRSGLIIEFRGGLVGEVVLAIVGENNLLREFELTLVSWVTDYPGALPSADKERQRR